MEAQSAISALLFVLSFYLVLLIPYYMYTTYCTYTQADRANFVSLAAGFKDKLGREKKENNDCMHVFYLGYYLLHFPM